MVSHPVVRSIIFNKVLQHVKKRVPMCVVAILQTYTRFLDTLDGRSFGYINKAGLSAYIGDVVRRQRTEKNNTREVFG